ncbi:sensor histidine kinase [Persicimonas caeni]|nr:HAMP domain-containing sensor histidine kinase [Persicimonas caeni]
MSDSRRPSADRPSMQRVVMVTVTWITGLAILLFAAGLLYTFHVQIHQQTGQLLLQIARTEADGVISELEHGVHVHDMSVTLPTLRGEIADKYALAFDADCRVLAATDNITVQRVPRSWCTDKLKLGDQRLFHTDALAEPRLRAAWFVARRPDGSPLVFVAGVHDEMVHASVYRTAWVVVLLALVLLGVVLLAAWLVSRRLSTDLGALSATCEQITERAADLDDAELERQLAVADSAPSELAALAATVRDLVRRLNRMVQVQNRFIAEAAHELRTPLTALQGELELTLRRERSPEEYREALERALADARRLSGLYDGLLRAARTQSEEIISARIALDAAVADSLERFAGRLAEAGVRVEFDPGDARWAVRGDKVACARVLDNLFSNVVRHSSASTLSVRLESVREPLGTSGPVDQVVVHIEDDGDGIDADPSELFVPFAADSRAGHGLGLFITEKLMRKQGGALEYVAGPGGAHWLLRFRAVD